MILEVNSGIVVLATYILTILTRIRTVVMNNHCYLYWYITMIPKRPMILNEVPQVQFGLLLNHPKLPPAGRSEARASSPTWMIGGPSTWAQNERRSKLIVSIPVTVAIVLAKPLGLLAVASFYSTQTRAYGAYSATSGLKLLTAAYERHAFAYGNLDYATPCLAYSSMVLTSARMEFVRLSGWAVWGY